MSTCVCVYVYHALFYWICVCIHCLSTAPAKHFEAVEKFDTVSIRGPLASFMCN